MDKIANIVHPHTVQTSRFSAKKTWNAEGSSKNETIMTSPLKSWRPHCCLVFKLTAAFRTSHLLLHRSRHCCLGSECLFHPIRWERINGLQINSLQIIVCGPRNRQRIRRGNLQVEEQDRWSSLLELRRSIGSSTQSTQISGKMSRSLVSCQLVSQAWPWFFSATIEGASSEISSRFLTQKVNPCKFWQPAMLVR